MTVHEDGPPLRDTVATACRVLAEKGLVEGILGHVSARVASDELVVRCRGEGERGLRRTRAHEVGRVTLDGDGGRRPRRLQGAERAADPHRAHAKPPRGRRGRPRPPPGRAARRAGRLEPRRVFGAYNIRAMRLALDGVPVFPRPVLITRAELAAEMLDAMGGADVCLLRGHGITVAALLQDASGRVRAPLPEAAP